MSETVDEGLIKSEQFLCKNVPRKPQAQKHPLVQVYNSLCQVLPCLDWIPNYRHNKRYLIGDVLGGVTVGLMVIPQSMSYAMLAGLDPVYGLYSCFIPVIVYSLFASSKQLAVAPEAIVCLMTASTIAELKPRSHSDYVTYASLISLVAGLLQVLLGVFRLGFLVNFMSHAVIAGFTAGAALVISGAQLKHVIGVPMTDEKQFYLLVWKVFKNLSNIHWPTFLFSCICFGILLFMKYFRISFRGKEYKLTKVPGALIVVALSTLIMYLLSKYGSDFDYREKKVYGIKVLGEIPSGLPKPTLPIFLKADTFTIDKIQNIVVSSLTIALIAFLESIVVCKYLANRFKYQIDTNQELIALGLSCVTSGVFRGIPITGGLARTAINSETGAMTPLSGIITAFLVMIALLLLTKALFFLPPLVLACIVITGIMQFIDFGELVYIVKTKKRDAVSFLAAFIGTLCLGVEQGIIIAIAISIGFVLYRASRPRHSILGRIPDTNQYRNIAHWKEAITVPGVLVMRFDADLFFANATYIQDIIAESVEKEKHPVYALVLDCNSMNQVDSTAPHALLKLAESLSPIRIFFAQIKPEVLRVLKNGEIFNGELINEDQMFVTISEAVDFAVQQVKLELERNGVSQNSQQIDEETSLLVTINNNNN